MKYYSFILFLSLITTITSAQDYPKDFFRLPVDTVVRLGGNFGEIRWDHFHYGWDIRTGGQERMRIIAAGDGYVSRVRTGAYGYGKAIYITHPNGYVSVYAHLSEFNTAIADHVKAAQYKNESYETDLYPSKDELKIKKGEFIALSGNTGNSSGPHLHFEIRDEKTEEIINPYYFGLKIEDNVAPYFKTLAIYPVGNNSPKYISLIKKNGIYQFKTKDSIVVSGPVGFGIEVYDKESNSTGNNQVYTLEFQVDGKRTYYYELDKFAFDQTLYVNAHIDYKEQRKNNKNIQKAFLLPGNKFPIYKDVLNMGLVDITDKKDHVGKFIATDYYGNSSEFSFKFRSDLLSAKSQVKDCSAYEKDDDFFYTFLKFDTSNTVSNIFSLEIPKNSLFENTCLLLGNFPAPKENAQLKLAHTSIYSRMIQAGEQKLPLFYKCTLNIKCEQLPIDSLRNKLLIVSIDEKGNISSKGGEFKDGWVNTRVGALGTFAVVIDTTPPKIKAPVIPKTKNISALKFLDFRVADNLTGIKYYRATVDGVWFLLEYEPKKNSLFCKNDDRIPKGKHTIHLSVADGKGNVSNLILEYVK